MNQLNPLHNSIIPQGHLIYAENWTHCSTVHLYHPRLEGGEIIMDSSRAGLSAIDDINVD